MIGGLLSIMPGLMEDSSVNAPATSGSGTIAGIVRPTFSSYSAKSGKLAGPPGVEVVALWAVRFAGGGRDRVRPNFDSDGRIRDDVVVPVCVFRLGTGRRDDGHVLAIVRADRR